MTCKRGLDQVMKDIRYLKKGYVELLFFENRQHSHTKVNPAPELRYEQDRELFILTVCVLLLKRPFFFGINGPSITPSAMSANP